MVYRRNVRKRTWKKRSAVKRYRSSAARRRGRPMRPRYGPRRIGGLAKKHTARLRYSQMVTLDPTAGTIAAHIFRANSLFDPDQSGLGHQPYGFDQLMQWYDHYTVIGSKMTARPIPVGTPNVTPGVALIHLSDTLVQPFSSVDHMLESPGNSRWVTTGANPQNPMQRAVRKGFSMRKFFNKKLGEDDMQGTIASNPAEHAYFILMHGDISGNDPSPYTFQVTIDYIAVFTEPKILVQS